jgi:hypothetical protein
MLVVGSRFNGPPASGNGGYVCGLVSTLVDGDAEVTLRSPPPLDTEMDVARVPGGFEVLDGSTVVATAQRAEGEWPQPPAIPAWQDAVAASRTYVGFGSHEFPTCFTCGPERSDGLAIFPGHVAEDIVAAPWTPDRSLPNDEGAIDVPIVWAALDCPGAWVYMRDVTSDPVVLGRMAARILEPIEIGRRYISMAWPLGSEGRKSFAGTALIDDTGAPVAFSRQTWIAIRTD